MADPAICGTARECGHYRKVGFFLDVNKERFHVEQKDLEFLRSRKPAHKSYMFRMERTGKLVRDWNLIVPVDVLERAWRSRIEDFAGKAH